MSRYLIAAALLLSTACGTGGDNLGELLVDEGPARYELVRGPASGPLDLEEAAGATTLGRTELRRQLSRTGFQGAHSRVWALTEDDFFAAVVFDFLTEQRASELVDFMREQLGDKEAAVEFTVQGIPDAIGFTLAASPREGEGSVLCHMIAFAHDTTAFEVRGCAPGPKPLETVRQLAVRQHRAATGA